jgi:aspartate racemase
VKKIGLIGGIGPESTLLYYQKLVYGAQEKFGAHYFPRLTIESLNVFEVLAFCQAKDTAGLIRYLMNGIDSLVASGAELIALTGITPHIVFDDICRCSSVPLVSIVESSREAAMRAGFNRVGLLGTSFTMREDFFKRPLMSAGINVITPCDDEMNFIAEKITSELEFGVITETTRRSFVNIIQRLADEEKIDAVLLGCTELPLLLRDVPLPVEPLDTVQIHVDKLLQMG